MAQPSTELVTFRQRVTRVLDEMDNVRGVLAPIEGAGVDDNERAAFFAEWFIANPDYDITSAELIAGAVKLRQFETWLDTALPTLAKLRI